MFWNFAVKPKTPSSSEHKIQGEKTKEDKKNLTIKSRGEYKTE